MRRSARPDWKLIAGYAAALAAGTFALQWLDYLWIARTAPSEVYVALIAMAFLCLGLFAGMRLATGPRAEPHPGNPAAQQALGISARELTVLHQLAAGRSNKEIAIELAVSPNTVKTHVARLYEKLEVGRRTEAIGRARELGLLP